MNIIGHKYIYLTVSALLVAASIAAIALFGFKQGIDFAGGTLWQVRFTGEAAVEKSELVAFISAEEKISGGLVSEEADGFMIRLPEISEAEHQRILGELTQKFGAVEELRFESIGPAIGSELRSGAFKVFLMVLITISLYIAFAFRKVSEPVSSWKYGVITLLTLFHDALIAIGFFALLGKLYGAEVDVSFVVAILVVIGFSVHDTIVVFDRIRENLRISRGGEPFASLVNRSVNETFARSVNTSLTLVLVLLALYFTGAENLRYFMLTILVGTVVGTYSSIFIASPLLTFFRRRER